MLAADLDDGDVGEAGVDEGAHGIDVRLDVRPARDGVRNSTAIIASACSPASSHDCAPETATPMRGGGSPMSQSFAESTR